MSDPNYNEVRVVPNKFKSNPVNPTHELGFLKPKHKSTMNSVFKSSQSTSEIQEEILPTFWVPQAKASKMTKLTKYQITKHVVSWLLRNECPAVVTTTSSCYRFDLLRFLFFFLFSSVFSLLSVAVARHFLMRGKLFFYSKRFYFFFPFLLFYILCH